MDRITLSGVTAVGHHGVFDFERREGQPFVVDAVLYLDFAKAAESDDVRDTAHYGEVAQRITEWISGEPLNLIEALAVRIADGLLSEFRLEAVDITVHKPQAPIEVPFGDVAVSVHRARPVGEERDGDKQSQGEGP
ncbi:dihydroneopterin aldolase [Pseudarthrobacter oxydans]|jgi:dihydroneopterin aldolase|uniref:7,8-dihydroneopterin aldolase n=1 Tax=Pseudarthrobacter oxydans TaxID=1671 RepID=A0AAW8NA02_PSEOX|nr:MULTISPECIES: dihydroneopterin aldolase [Pseudarthrobacter]MDR6791770.1 dihydroneopterin aldolase [Pseudarthrobacter oxydans]MDR7163184.1 dihydroneopterin aldolase [Pseudarthrobacter oxydans]BFE43291.1 dihydroneopterin aldolase [Pseudarthrobacter oxydans]GKV71394.1 7,8-dihydroneopterin aldolase [Pseudarthrobacter sp. NCCP-2145]